MDPNGAFPHAKLRGSHRDIGRQHGETFRTLVHTHLDYALDNLKQRGTEPAEALSRAQRYRPFVQAHAAFLDEEVQGVAEGAGLDLAQAYLLQLRAEVSHASRNDPGDECTTYAIEPSASANGEHFLGQNADLPPFYADLCVVLEIHPPAHPAVMMVTPAGQVSYIGMNAEGFAAGGNYLTCEGWTEGFPRYLLTRLALTCQTIDEAADLIDGLPRASSRNLIMVDPRGRALDLETTPDATGRVQAEGGLLVHANHFIAKTRLGDERATGRDLENSRIRLAAMRQHLEAERGALTVAHLMRAMRDRGGAPNALCRYPGEGPGSTSTVAAMIAQPARDTLWASVGPPDQHCFHAYRFGQHEVHSENPLLGDTSERKVTHA